MMANDVALAVVDIVDETPAQSVPTSDAPGWAIGWRRARGPRGAEQTDDASSSHRKGGKRAQSAANVKIARRFFEDVLIRQSALAVDELIAPGAVIDLPTGRFTGPEGVRGASARIGSAFPDLRVEVEEVSAAGNQVVATWRLCGTQQRELFGVPPSGRRECVSGQSQFRIVDTKIVEHQMTEGESAPEAVRPERFAST